MLHISQKLCWLITVACALTPGGKLIAAENAQPFRINLVDRANGWPVPLIVLTTTHGVRFVSDNAGVIAFDLPELMGQPVWLELAADGYELKRDGFGYQGFRVIPRRGDSVTIELSRTNLAKRLGRLTGGGLFAESQKCGDSTEWRESGVLGCDSVQTAMHQGRMFWAWGDTTLARYPLGIFHMTGATTSPAPLRQFEPPLKLIYNYFVDDQETPRAIAKLPGDGPTWLSGLVSLPDAQGRALLGASYSKIKPPLEAYEIGLCVWNESLQAFQAEKVVWRKTAAAPQPPATPQGHAVRWLDDAGHAWMLFGDPFPSMRCRATWEAWRDPASWESLSPQPLVAVHGSTQMIEPHRGSITWQEHRQKWITIFCELNGEPSPLGEIWYAEADSPHGPWRDAVKVVSHAEYTFYNPRLHPELPPQKAEFLLFEATYTKTFSPAKVATPRYDYNQIMYRLDFADLPITPAG
ncbi:hypothetical protein SH139x_002910 [Planctomycetaceae bacterium SH139]